MNPSIVYEAVNFAVLPFWLLLVFAPYRGVTNLLVHSGLVPMVLGILYGFLFLLAAPDPDASAMTLEGVRRLFDDPWIMTVAWTHYLVFDLFVGAWQVRDARRHALPHLAVLPGLFGTFMFGPLGLLWYVVLRLGLRRTWSLEESGGGALG